MFEESTIAEALTQSSGNVSAAAKAIGMSRRQLIRRIETSETLAELIDDLRQSLVDEAEACIATSIKGGDVKTAQWYLLSSAAGRSRGYSKDGDSADNDSEQKFVTVEVVVDTPDQVQQILKYEEFANMASEAVRNVPS